MASKTPFMLHPQIARDTLPIGGLPLCQALLMQDSRFPWVLLVPRRGGVSEITDLADSNRLTLMEEIDHTSRILKEVTGCTRINIAAFGNMVPQLHVHIIARFENDPAWPGSAIGFGDRTPYDPKAAKTVTSTLLHKLTQAQPLNETL